MHLLHRPGNTCWQPSIISPVWSILRSQRGDDEEDDGDNDGDSPVLPVGRPPVLPTICR